MSGGGAWCQEVECQEMECGVKKWSVGGGVLGGGVWCQEVECQG